MPTTTATRGNTAEVDKKYFLGKNKLPVVCTGDEFKAGRNNFAYREGKENVIITSFLIKDNLILGDLVLIYDGAGPIAGEYLTKHPLLNKDRKKVLSKLEKHNL